MIGKVNGLLCHRPKNTDADKIMQWYFGLFFPCSTKFSSFRHGQECLAGLTRDERLADLGAQSPFMHVDLWLSHKSPSVVIVGFLVHGMRSRLSK
eukprot:12381557-Karenia_brevis.AAC.1